MKFMLKFTKQYNFSYFLEKYLRNIKFVLYLFYHKN